MRALRSAERGNYVELKLVLQDLKAEIEQDVHMVKLRKSMEISPETGASTFEETLSSGHRILKDSSYLQPLSEKKREEREADVTGLASALYEPLKG